MRTIRLVILTIAVISIPFPAWAQAPSAETPREFTCVQDAPEQWTLRYVRNADPSRTLPKNSVCVVVPPETPANIQITRLKGVLFAGDVLASEFVGDGSACQELGPSKTNILWTKIYKYRGVGILLITVTPNPIIPNSDPNIPSKRLDIDEMELSFTIDIPAATTPYAIPRDLGRGNILRLVVENQQSIGPLLAAFAPPPPGSATPDIAEDDPAPFLPATREFAGAHGPVVKMRVTAAGFQQVMGRDLRGAGIDLNRVRPGSVQGWIGKEQAPVHVRSATPGLFTDEDSILFRVEDSLSEHEPWRTCWLSFQSSGAGEIPSIPSATAAGAFEQSWVWMDEEVRERNSFVSVREDPGMSRAGWFWRSSEESAMNAIGLPCPGVIAGSSILVEAHYMTNNRVQDGRVLSVLASETIPETTALMSPFKRSAIASAYPDRIVDGTRLWLQFKFPGTHEPQEKFYIESARVQYARQPSTASGPFSFRLVKEASGADNITVPVRLRIDRDPGQPVELWSTNAEGKTRRFLPLDQADPAFADYILQPASGEVYHLSEIRQARRPVEIRIDAPSDCSGAGTPCDYVIIAHRDFMGPDLDRLANHRRAEGLRVLTLDAEDVYDEFNGGETSPAAIQTFLHQAASTWPRGGPEYVLLVGDANWDTFDWSGSGVPNRMPTFLDKNDPRNSFCSDDRFVQFKYGEDIPQYAIGRISPQSVSDLRNLVDKIIESESNPLLGPWRARVLFAADQEPKHDEFRPVCQRLVDQYVCSPMQGEVFDFSRFPFQNHNAVISKAPDLKYRTSPGATANLMERLNRGASLVQYLGHGGPPVWSKAQLMLGLDREDSDIRQLKNKGMYPFVTSLSCLCGSFHQSQYTYDICLAEDWQRQKDAGSIAMLAPSGGGSTSQHEVYSAWLTDYLVNLKCRRIGDAVTAAKIAFQIRNGSYFTNEQIFFGDPASHFPRPSETLELHAAVDPDSQPRSGDLISLRVRANASSALDGQVLVECTIKGKSGDWDQGPFPMQGGKSEFTLQIPRDLGDEAPSVLIYAWDDARGIDAAGVLDLQPRVTMDAAPVLSNAASASSITLKLHNPSGLLLDPGRLDITWEDGNSTSIPCTISPRETHEVHIPIPPATSELKLASTRLAFTVPFFVSEPNAARAKVYYPSGRVTDSTPSYLLSLGDFQVGSLTLEQALAKTPMNVTIACWNIDAPTPQRIQVALIAASTGEQIGSAALDIRKRLSFSKPISWRIDSSTAHSLLIEGPASSTAGGAAVRPPAPATVKLQSLEPFDLVLQNPVLISGPSPYGEPIVIDVTVANLGQSEARDIRFKAYDGPNITPDAEAEVWPDQDGPSLAVLKPGESRRMRVRCHGYKPFKSEMLKLSVGSHIPELTDLHPDDNVISLTVRETGDPDLFVHALEIEKPPAYSKSEDRFRVSARVANLGDGPATRVLIRFSTRGKEWGDPVWLPSIAPGQTVIINNRLPVKEGSHVLTVTADPWNALREKNDQNNSAAARIDTHVVQLAEAAGWVAGASGWSFDLDPERDWSSYNRLRCHPGAGGMIRYVPGLNHQWVGTWKNLLVNTGDAVPTRDQTWLESKFYVDNHEVFLPFNYEAPPVRFALPAEEGPCQVEIEIIRAREFYGAPSTAFKYRFGPGETFHEFQTDSLLPRNEKVRLARTEVTDGILNLEIDDHLKTNAVRIMGNPLISPSGGRLTSPILDMNTSGERVLKAGLEAPFPRPSNAWLEYRAFDSLTSVDSVAWKALSDAQAACNGRYFQWRVVFDGQIAWYAWLKNLTLLEKKDSGIAHSTPSEAGNQG